MEPPRPRRRRARRRPLSPFLTMLVINAIALYWTVLLARGVLLLVPAGERLDWASLLRGATEPAVLWLSWLPPLRVRLAGELTLSEPLALLLSGIVAAMALGVLAGWQEEARWFRRRPIRWRREGPGRS
uniref:YggT family protein n=1 Tax=Thermorudis peleae TaxID=1382356 RepID=A0A831T9J5_9BACT